MSGVARAEGFHESYSGREGVKPPSDRSIGIVFTVAAVIVALWWRDTLMVLTAALVVAGVLAFLSLAAPWVLRPLNLAWFQIGLLLHRVVNPIVMLAMFVVVFLPAGLLMRIWADPLRLQRAEPGASYWIDRTPGARGQEAAGAMTNQF